MRARPSPEIASFVSCCGLDPGGPVQFVHVNVEAATLWRMAQHGPVTCVLNSYIANEAKKLAWTPRFDYGAIPS